MRITAGQKVLGDPIRIRLSDWLLIAGLTLAPMTSLRIWKVGPGEVLCLLWGIRFLFTNKSRNNDVTLFFIPFIAALALGSLAGYIIAPDELRITELFTWIYLGVIAISIYNGLRRNTKEYNERLLFVFGLTAALWYLFLFLYSRFVSRTFLGAPLWYSSRRFSGGATNPHQIAILLCGLTFVFLRKILSKEKLLISIGGLAVCLFLIAGTDSSTAILSVALGIMISMYFFVAAHFKNKKTIMVLMTLIILSVAAIGFSVFFDLFLEWVGADTNGMGRLEIFASFPNSFMKSPLVGLGPGVHGKNGTIEFHNSYLEVLAATGLLGGIIFLIFSVKMFKKSLAADWRLFVITVSMYAYGLAGFAMRRLVFWGLLAFVVVISEQGKEACQLAADSEFCEELCLPETGE